MVISIAVVFPLGFGLVKRARWALYLLTVCPQIEVGRAPFAARKRQASSGADFARNHAVLLLATGAKSKNRSLILKRGSSEPETVPRVPFLHPSSMLVGGRITPVAVIGGLIIMIAALIFVALSRSHSAPPQAPMHQPSQ